MLQPQNLWEHITFSIYAWLFRMLAKAVANLAVKLGAFSQCHYVLVDVSSKQILLYGDEGAEEKE